LKRGVVDLAALNRLKRPNRHETEKEKWERGNFINDRRKGGGRSETREPKNFFETWLQSLSLTKGGSSGSRGALRGGDGKKKDLYGRRRKGGGAGVIQPVAGWSRRNRVNRKSGFRVVGGGVGAKPGV